MTDTAASTKLPPWDLLPLNAYLVSLLPIEETCQYLPTSIRSWLPEVLQAVACVGLLVPVVGKGNTPSKINNNNPPNRRQMILYSLLVLEHVLPKMVSLLRRAWDKYRSSRQQLQQQQRTSVASTPILQQRQQQQQQQQQLARQRQQKISKLLQSFSYWLRFVLWLQLYREPMATMIVSSSNDKQQQQQQQQQQPNSQLQPVAHVLYAYRRWMHLELLECYQTLIRPLLEAASETRRLVMGG